MNMTHKAQLTLIITLTVLLLGCIDTDADKNYTDITFEECEITVQKFRKYMKEEVFPIVDISKVDVSKASNMIHLEVIKELQTFESSINLCSRKQIYSDNEQKNHYNFIVRDLFSLIMYLENIRDNRSSGAEFLDILFDFMRKNYYEVMELAR